MSVRRLIYTGTRAPDLSAMPTLELVHLPVLCTRPLPLGSHDALRALLSQPHQLVFFSQHAIHAHTLARLPTTHTTRVWCVGKHTRRVALDAWPSLREQILMTEENHQHYQGLVKSMSEVRAREPAIVFGLKDATRPLADDLRDAGAPQRVHAFDAYESAPRDDLDAAFARAFCEPVDWVLYASPRAVMASAALLKQPPYSMARIAAIGRTTASAVEAAGLSCGLVASEPSVEVLCQDIANLGSP